MVILAFDSGVERTGYAVFEKSGGAEKLLTYGCIFTDKKWVLARRLADIRRQVSDLLDAHTPDIFVLERLFFNKNVTTAMMVAQSQGAVMSLAGERDIPVEFLTPQQIKQTLTGYGTSDKKNVQKMVQLLLKLKVMPEPDDTADAIACGLTYCTMRQF
jgi:crossover junction endodeoxyribonuclease RuvC